MVVVSLEVRGAGGEDGVGDGLARVAEHPMNGGPGGEGGGGRGGAFQALRHVALRLAAFAAKRQTCTCWLPSNYCC